MSDMFRWVSKLELSPVMFATLLVWFSANLISQLIYMAIYGGPYDGVGMLASLGWIYYVIIVAELLLWVWLLGVLILKVINHSTNDQPQCEIGINQLPNKSTTSG